MKPPSQMSRTAVLVEAALMVAFSFVLSLIPHFSMPLGGSISWFSTLPLVLISLRHGGRWGVGTAAAYGVLQAVLGMSNVMAAKTAPAMVLCVLLDYFLSYACVGLTGPIARRFKNATAGLSVGIAATGLMRLFCSFLSGILIWGAWAPETWPVWWYSLLYNAAWCLPDVALVLAATLVLSRVKALYLLGDPGKPLATAE